MITVLNNVIAVAIVIAVTAVAVIVIAGIGLAVDEFKNRHAYNTNMAADEALKRLRHAEQYFVKQFENDFSQYNRGFDNTGEFRYRQRSLNDVTMDVADQQADTDIINLFERV